MGHGRFEQLIKQPASGQLPSNSNHPLFLHELGPLRMRKHGAQFSTYNWIGATACGLVALKVLVTRRTDQCRLSQPVKTLNINI
jgi:hypothetical protein